jgi:hypothetical protein
MAARSSDADRAAHGNMPHSNILLATGAAIRLMKASRACESLRMESNAIFSFSDCGFQPTG